MTLILISMFLWTSFGWLAPKLKRKTSFLIMLYGADLAAGSNCSFVFYQVKDEVINLWFAWCSRINRNAHYYRVWEWEDVVWFMNKMQKYTFGCLEICRNFTWLCPVGSHIWFVSEKWLFLEGIVRVKLWLYQFDLWIFPN